MKKFILPLCGIFTVGVANADGLYVGAKLGVTDFVVNSDQDFAAMPEIGFYKSPITHGNISDINATYYASAGYDFGHVRMEFEYGYGRYATSGKWTLNIKNPIPDMAPIDFSYPATYSLTDHVSTFMVNGYGELFRFGRRYHRRMYGGQPHRGELRTYNSLFVTAGVGMAHISETGAIDVNTAIAWIGDRHITASADTTVNRFAYNVGGGVSLGLTENAYVDIMYRFAGLGRWSEGDTTRRYQTHTIAAGVRYMF